jgi:hypothetical protein
MSETDLPKVFFTEWRGESILLLTVLLFLLLCLIFLANDLAILSVILLFREIRGWKSRKIVRDLWRAQKGNSFHLKGKSIEDYLTNMNNKSII